MAYCDTCTGSGMTCDHHLNDEACDCDHRQDVTCPDCHGTGEAEDEDDDEEDD